MRRNKLLLEHIMFDRISKTYNDGSAQKHREPTQPESDKQVRAN